MPPIAKFILTQQEPKKVTKRWAAQKGAQVDADGMPPRALITRGPQADCKQAGKLIEGCRAKHLLADRAYDIEQIIKQAKVQGMASVIPTRKNRKRPRPYDKGSYKLRQVVANTILRVKRWQCIATQYAKNAISFLTAVHIKCLALWLNISCDDSISSKHLVLKNLPCLKHLAYLVSIQPLKQHPKQILPGCGQCA